MGFSVEISFLLFLLLGDFIVNVASDISYDQNYKITWGYDHVLSLSQGTEIQLSLDKSSGAGFVSKLSFGSGFFHMKIKLTENDSAGVVTAFYLTSKGNNHDELDFEFLGNTERQPIYLQTNVFTNGLGNREQKISLWFDPTADFHDYKILWNQHQIVFFADDTPIRVFKNKTNIGVGYPSHPVFVEASIWDGSDWATNGGRTKINWSHAPFKAHFQGFDINGCSIQESSSIEPCLSPSFSWNGQKYWNLDSAQQRAYENVKNKYLIYDYCSDRKRYPTPPPECSQ